MKDFDTIHESFLGPGVQFSFKDKKPGEILKIRRANMQETGMLWITARAKITFGGDLDQGRVLIMIWKN